MRTVVVVISARASYSRFKTALLILNQNPDIDLRLVLTASAAIDAFGSVARQVTEDGLTVCAMLPVNCFDNSLCGMAVTTGALLQDIARLLNKIDPDLVITIADRYETLATAIAAAYQNYPLIHIQGGEETGSIDDKVRHAITKLADTHLVSTERAKDRLLRMGESAERIVVTGCPSCDLAAETMKKKQLSGQMLHRYTDNPKILSLQERQYFVLLFHGVTDEFEKTQSNLESVLRAVIKVGAPTIWIAPNIDPGANAIRGMMRSSNADNIFLLDSMDNMDFLELLFFSKGIVGNSSVGIRECSFLGVPAVNVGTRQLRRERGPNVIDVGYDSEQIFRALCGIEAYRGKRSDLYGDGHSAERIAAAVINCPLRSKKVLSFQTESEKE